MDADGQVLLLGVGLESNTVFHTVEALADVGYLLEDAARSYTILDRFGQHQELCVWCHRNAIARRFGAMEPLLADQGILQAQRIGGERALLINGRAFRDFMTECVKKHPGFLLAAEANDIPLTAESPDLGM